MCVVWSIISCTLATSSETAFAFYCARRVEIDVLGIAEELSRRRTSTKAIHIARRRPLVSRQIGEARWGL